MEQLSVLLYAVLGGIVGLSVAPLLSQRWPKGTADVRLLEGFVGAVASSASFSLSTSIWAHDAIADAVLGAVDRGTQTLSFFWFHPVICAVLTSGIVVVVFQGFRRLCRIGSSVPTA